MKNEISNFAYIITGSALLAFGVVSFIVPGQIATGGTPGIAILLHYVTGLPTGLLMVKVVNVPL